MRYILSAYLIIIISITNGKSQENNLRLIINETYYQSVKNNEYFIITADGETDSTITKTNYKLAFKVIESSKNDFLLKSYFKNIHLVNLTSDGTFEYMPQNASQFDLLSSIMANIINQPFSIRLSKQGKVIEIKDLEKVIKSSIKNLPENMTSQFEEMFTRWYGSNIISRNLEIITTPLPLKTDTNNSNWTIKQSLMSIPNEELNIMYEITNNDSNTYNIKGNCTIDKEKTETEDSNIKVISNATFSLNASYKKSTKWFINGEVTEHIKGKLKITDIDEIKDWIPFQMITTTSISDKE
ncbi:MAG: hypothetical protein JW717_05810 [Marinilabiliaceae bacterium]|nr:hypothetical protein [Marinilabiliaceae bacterium]